MLTLLRTEQLKLTTTRWPWILVAVALEFAHAEALRPLPRISSARRREQERES